MDRTSMVPNVQDDMLATKLYSSQMDVIALGLGMVNQTLRGWLQN